MVQVTSWRMVLRIGEWGWIRASLPRRSSGAAPARHPTERSRATSPGSSLFQAGVRVTASVFLTQRFRHWSCCDRVWGSTSGGLFAFKTPASADYSLTCGHKAHTPCRGQRRHVTSPLPLSFYCARDKERTRFLLKLVVIKRRFL